MSTIELAKISLTEAKMNQKSELLLSNHPNKPVDCIEN
jgi:hypothetical protein